MRPISAKPAVAASGRACFGGYRLSEHGRELTVALNALIARAERWAAETFNEKRST
jgi:hypothetical protein